MNEKVCWRCIILIYKKFGDNDGVWTNLQMYVLKACPTFLLSSDLAFLLHRQVMQFWFVQNHNKSLYLSIVFDALFVPYFIYIT